MEVLIIEVDELIMFNRFFYYIALGNYVYAFSKKSPLRKKVNRTFIKRHFKETSCRDINEVIENIKVKTTIVKRVEWKY